MGANDIGTLSVHTATWSDYLVERTIIYAAGHPETREPLDARTRALLPSFLARVSGTPGSRLDTRVPALLAFYRAFGFLAPAERSLPAPGRRRPWIRSSEWIAWALRHARNVQTIMALHRARGRALESLLAALESRPRPRVRDAAAGHDVVDEIERRRLVVPAPRQDERLPQLLVERRQQEPDLAFSRRIIDQLLTPNLAHVRRGYDTVEGVPRFVGHHLIDAVYWQLANDLTSGEVRQCLSCGGLFFAQDKRQKVCPPLVRKKDGKTVESPCGWRHRNAQRQR